MAHIYIIYNADSTALGKFKYACAKMMSSSSDSPCSACDLTHNGLHLTETAQWSAAKKRIGGADVQQLHRDELSIEVSKCALIPKNTRAQTDRNIPAETIHRFREAGTSRCAWARIYGRDLEGSDDKSGIGAFQQGL